MTKTSKTEFKIESGIPPPNRRYGAKYPWRELKINQSFLVPDEPTHGKRSPIYSQSGWATKRYGIKIVMRRVDGGVRVWRVE